MTALAPFGTFAPQPWQARLMGVTQKLPENWLGRRFALWLRKPVLLKLGKNPADVERLGYKLRLVPHDNVSEKRVLFTPQFFDSDELALLRQRIRPGFRFLDIGANAGLYALFVAARAGADANIIAVEPQPAMLERLNTNIALNGFASVHVAPIALADRDGTIRFHLSADNRGQASLVGDGEALDVPCRTLLSLMDTRGMEQADAMKIDIEGAEDIVLAPFFKSAPRARWPKLIFMERNSSKWRLNILALLLQSGYRELAPGRMNVILELQETK